MAVAQLYPGAKWTPLGAQTEQLMSSHDIACLHTMVGYLVSTDRYFRVYNGSGYSGTESHYGVGGKWGPDLGGDLDGAVWQWQDRRYTADANLFGNKRVISIETADNAPRYASDIEPWTPRQIEACARIIAWEASPSAHRKCPSTWTCHKVGIPLTLIPDTKPGRRGIAYHRQGIDPWRVSGGELWSTSRGKECPATARIRQVPTVIARARQLSFELASKPITIGTTIPDPTVPGGFNPEEDDMTPEQAKQLAEVHKALTNPIESKISGKPYSPRQIWQGGHKFGYVAAAALTTPLTSQISGEEYPPRQFLPGIQKFAHTAVTLLQAQQPLLEAAAKGEGLNAEQVAQIAAACAAAVPQDLAEDVVDEFTERIADDES